LQSYSRVIIYTSLLSYIKAMAFKIEERYLEYLITLVEIECHYYILVY